MSDGSAKQQIVDKIKNTTNILVTVSSNPSVDELSAALGLTLLLNKMKKHATAVFSGEIPPAITFLEPKKTFENTVDSLRDFIIALDKEKADHLRYKVEGDVVKIFITPYRTTITGDDLDFSQGDYNVEMVLALGVKNQDNLDKALEAHGRILHDATVVTIMAGGDKSELGSIGWRDDSASSLSEMIVTLSDALKNDRSLIDEQIATAFLAGIVAATERFSNNRTSARVMTMAAQLMGAGANQQLIASKFEAAIEEEGDIKEPEPPVAPVIPEDTSKDMTPEPSNHDGTTDLSEGESTKVDRSESLKDITAPEEAVPAPEETADGTLNVSHEKSGTLEEVAVQTVEENHAEAVQVAESKLANQTAVNQESFDTLPQVVEPAIDTGFDEPEETVETPPLQGAVSNDAWKGSIGEPSLGGTLNATTEAAAEDARREEEGDRNKTILSHGTGYIAGEAPAYSSPINATNAAALKREDELPIVNPLEEPQSVGILPPPVPPTLQDIDRQSRSMNGLPPLPDFSTLPPLPTEQPLPVQPDNGIPPMPETLGELFPPAAPAPETPSTNDPAQFKIPGQ